MPYTGLGKNHNEPLPSTQFTWGSRGAGVHERSVLGTSILCAMDISWYDFLTLCSSHTGLPAFLTYIPISRPLHLPCPRRGTLCLQMSIWFAPSLHSSICSNATSSESPSLTTLFRENPFSTIYSQLYFSSWHLLPPFLCFIFLSVSSIKWKFSKYRDLVLCTNVSLVPRTVPGT